MNCAVNDIVPVEVHELGEMLLHPLPCPVQPLQQVSSVDKVLNAVPEGGKQIAVPVFISLLGNDGGRLLEFGLRGDLVGSTSGLLIA